MSLHIAPLLTLVVVLCAPLSNAWADFMPPSVREACGLDEAQYLDLLQAQSQTYTDQDWIRVCRQLRQIGLKTPSFFLHQQPDLLSADDIVDTYQRWDALGLVNLPKLVIEHPFLLGLSVENIINPVISILEHAGLPAPIALIEKYPALLRIDPNTLRSKIEAIHRLGLKKPAKFIERFPEFLKQDIEATLVKKLAAMKKAGFMRPERVLEAAPRIFKLSIDQNLLPTLDDLEALGFQNVIKMVEKNPNILGLRMENVRAKIEALRNLGFRDPTRMIEKFPSLLGFTAEGTIRPKIAAFEKLAARDVLPMIETYPNLLGLSLTNNVMPKWNHLVREWGLNADEICRRPALFYAALSRSRRVHQFLTALGVDVRGLPLAMKYRAISNLAESDLLFQLQRHEFTTPAEQLKAFEQTDLLPDLFRRSTCDVDLTEG